jgi:hypothetical protein
MLLFGGNPSHPVLFSLFPQPQDVIPDLIGNPDPFFPEENLDSRFRGNTR